MGFEATAPAFLQTLLHYKISYVVDWSPLRLATAPCPISARSLISLIRTYMTLDLHFLMYEPGKVPPLYLMESILTRPRV